jgi:hypothetical protein
MSREFTCRDCGDHVLSYAEPHANDQDICAKCAWLREVEDPKDREMLRAFLRFLTLPKGG